ncbi:uncharacterized protein LOC133716541 [Rosa rugosa]|uniref:uncharacterized protein LOC133716541 n=1 Tax=Rosa rugosa TaxID=74645 RepID=UPI002B4026CC|nr:uncharacterized protein LOC133716541 [Rosa rugosa]
MLAKQGWRILSNPVSLIARLFKARYFPACFFWEAELGDAPSFSWRSILQGRPVLKAGVQWHVGDGNNINIWCDKWIPSCPQYRIQKPPNTNLEVVADLIDARARVWNTLKIRDLLPTKATLLHKGYTGDTDCLLCPATFEDRAHIFCKCPTAQTILSAPPFNLQASLLPRLNFIEWMLEQAINLKHDTFEKLLMILWALWKNRNNKFWDGCAQTSTDIVFSSFSWLDEFRKARHDAAAKPVKMQKKTWKPDPEKRWKLNVDGSFLPNQTKGGLGGVLRDGDGCFKATFTQPVHHVDSAKQVELLAIKEGWQLLQSLKVQSVVIESNCLEVTLDIENQRYDLIDYSAIIDDIRMTMVCFPGVQICFAPRTCNAVAYRLASIAFDDNYTSVWIDKVPECILDVLQSDCNQPT